MVLKRSVALTQLSYFWFLICYKFVSVQIKNSFYERPWWRVLMYENSAEPPSVKDHMTKKTKRWENVFWQILCSDVSKILQGIYHQSFACLILSLQTFLDSEEVFFGTRYMFVQTSRQFEIPLSETFAIEDQHKRVYVVNYLLAI